MRHSGWKRCFQVGTLAFFGFGAGSLWAQAVQPRIEMDRPLLPSGQLQPLYVLVEFEVEALERSAAEQRPPLNLALVLDRSGSMEDRGKMEYAKRAAALVVDQLQDSDRLAVVEYDDQVTVLWPSAPVEAPELVKRRIAALEPRGSTDLTGGMSAGAEQVASHYEGEAVNRVLLLSDGLANHGITEPARIRERVRRFREQGVAVTTLGLGLDYNEDLMQAVAENGGGNYYYIENPAQIGRIFQREMNTLFATAAKEAEVVFEGLGGVEEIEVFGFPAEIGAGSARIPMEDFYTGEKRSLLLRLMVRTEHVGVRPVGRLTLSYADQRDGERHIIHSDLEIEVTVDARRVEDAVNQTVAVEAALIEADKRHADGVRLYEAGDKASAQGALAGLANELEGLMQASGGDVKLAKKIEALRLEEEEMDAADADGALRSAYLKKSKQRAYQAQKGRRSLYVLQEGDAGPEVENLQKKLEEEGLYSGPVDGRFSPALKEALMVFQKREGLAADGVAGPQTLKGLQLY